MTKVMTWWQVVTDQDNSQYAYATKIIAIEGEKGLVQVRKLVPMWFAIFAHMNTEGVDAACNYYLGYDGSNNLPKENPFKNTI